jgi:hypothetical protein
MIYRVEYGEMRHRGGSHRRRSGSSMFQFQGGEAVTGECAGLLEGERVGQERYCSVPWSDELRHMMHGGSGR